MYSTQKEYSNLRNVLSFFLLTQKKTLTEIVIYNIIPLNINIL